MSQTYRLVIKGARDAAEKALRTHGFSSWRITQGTAHETFVDVDANVAHGDADDATVYVMSVLNSWFAEDAGDGNLKPGSLLFWKTYEPRHGAVGYASKRTKILRDLDGVDTDLPLWATVRSRRT